MPIYIFIRNTAATESSVPPTSSANAPPGALTHTLKPSSTTLFRYSALTFNGHRIHYDWPYATDTEGYPGLVVHGPLMATLSLRAFCRANPQAQVRRFAYRGVRPLIAPHPFVVRGRAVAVGKAVTCEAAGASRSP